MPNPFRLSPQAVKRVACQNKQAILAEVAHRFSTAYELDESVVLESLEEREALGSTGFGREVAMPHARLDELEDPVAVLLHLEHDVDFDAADGLPVRLVFGLVSPTNAGVAHLHALAAMSRMTRDERLLHRLFEAQSEEELFALIANSDWRDAA